MSLVGAVLSLAPWKLTAAKSSIQRLRLPPACIHIPHGNFAAAEIEKLAIPEFDLECTVQVFMRNGIDTKDSDLKVLTCQRGEEFLHISITRKGEVSTDGQLDGVSIDIDSFEATHFAISKR